MPRLMRQPLKSRPRGARLIAPMLIAVLVSVLLPRLSGCASPAPYTLIADNLHLANYAPARSSIATPDSLRVAAYNIYLAQDIDLAIADLQANPNLAGADILLLQEMDTLAVDRIARALGMNYVYWPSFVQPRSGRLFGNAVLASWPIVDRVAVPLPHPNPIIGLRRLGVAADVQVGDRRVRAVSVHLSTMAVPLDRRLEQAQTLVDSLGTATGPIIFAGDFNTVGRVGRNEVSRLMRRAGYRAVPLPPGPTAQSRISFLGLRLVLDHIYERGFSAARSGVDRTARASDHYPIWAVLTWDQEP